jgi:hypothetical protein
MPIFLHVAVICYTETSKQGKILFMRLPWQIGQGKRMKKSLRHFHPEVSGTQADRKFPIL